MTCIVGLADGSGTMHMGADSAGMDRRYNLSIRANEKVFKKNQMLMGFTTSFRMGQLLRYALEVPFHEDNKNDYEYMVVDFIDSVRGCFEKAGYLKKEHNREEAGTFLVGYRGIIYTIFDDFQVATNVDAYAACGCGDVYAISSLYNTNRLIKDEKLRIKLALETAEHFCGGVRGPFNIMRLKWKR